MSTAPIQLKFKRLPGAEDVELPAYQTSGAAGMDVRAAESLVLPVGETALVATGFCMEIPEGYEAQVRPRSGLAAKHGITILNSPGTIDHDYRGEVKIILTNLGRENFQILRGDRIAQLVIAKFERPEILEVAELESSARGAGGFGHTGKS